MASRDEYAEWLMQMIDGDYDAESLGEMKIALIDDGYFLSDEENDEEDDDY